MNITNIILINKLLKFGRDTAKYRTYNLTRLRINIKSTSAIAFSKNMLK